MENPVTWESTKKTVDLLSGLAVIFTLVFIALQWREMHAGSADTHDLAVAAKSQADAAKAQADNTTKMAETAKSESENTKNLALAAKDQVAKLQAGVRETHALVQATRDTISEMQDKFVKEERPYMWPRPQAPVFEKGKPIRWDVHFVNYGKSPAIHTRTCVMLIVGPDAMSKAANQTEQSLLEECKKSTQPGTESDSIAPPGDLMFTTAQSQIIPQDDNTMMFYRDVDFRVVLLALVTYGDVSGNHYSSLSCTAHLGSGAGFSCAQGNFIK